MSAAEYLLMNHVRVDHLRQIAQQAGVDASEIISYRHQDTSPLWAEAYVRTVGPAEAIRGACANLSWGRRALYDFPLARDISLNEVLEQARQMEAGRGDVLEWQAETGIAPLPRVAIARRLNDSLALIVTDQAVEHQLPQEGVGLARHAIPKWVICALARRTGGWRLEVYSEYGDALAVATTLIGQLDLRPLLANPANLTLTLAEIDHLSDRLQAPIKRRSVFVHHEQTGLRKVSAEVGGGTRDIREASFWPTIDGVTDEADTDTIEVPWEGTSYTVQVSKHGSFWFRSYAPRELIDAVLEQAEGIGGN